MKQYTCEECGHNCPKCGTTHFRSECVWTKGKLTNPSKSGFCQTCKNKTTDGGYCIKHKLAGIPVPICYIEECDKYERRSK